MKFDVIKLDGGKAGSIDLNDALFGLDPRADILHRVVRWQRAKAQAGTHSTLTRAEVSYSTKKIYRRRAPAALATGPRKRRSSATVVLSKARSRAATPMTCRSKFALWVCVTPCPPRPRPASW